MDWSNVSFSDILDTLRKVRKTPRLQVMNSTGLLVCERLHCIINAQKVRCFLMKVCETAGLASYSLMLHAKGWGLECWSAGRAHTPSAAVGRVFQQIHATQADKSGFSHQVQPLLLPVRPSAHVILHIVRNLQGLDHRQRPALLDQAVHQVGALGRNVVRRAAADTTRNKYTCRANYAIVAVIGTSAFLIRNLLGSLSLGVLTTGGLLFVDSFATRASSIVLKGLHKVNPQLAMKIRAQPGGADGRRCALTILVALPRHRM